MKMKKYNLITLCFILAACLNTNKTLGQTQNNTSTTPPRPYLKISNHLPDSHKFEAIHMPELNGSTAAFYSYLWWMGDNGFSFDSVPKYAFRQNRAGMSTIVSMVGTGNYSTGGPPPLHRPFVPSQFTSDITDLFDNDENLSIQNYRNAVVGDTMYLLVSYRIPVEFEQGGTYSGTIRLDTPVTTSMVANFANAGNSFTPNGELFDGRNTWLFRDLEHGDERTILIPIKINSTESEHLNFRVYLNFEENDPKRLIDGVSYASLETAIAESHDPNQMIAHSNAMNDCDYGGKPINYTIQFQNEGDRYTEYVKVVCVLDDKLNMHSIDNIEVPNMYNNVTHKTIQEQGYTRHLEKCNYIIDSLTHSITFEFNGLFLLPPADPLCKNLSLTRDQVSFSINMLPNFRFGPSVVSIAEITFDSNHVIVTNNTTVICQDSLSEGGGFYTVDPPNPSNPTKNKLLLTVAALLSIVGVVVGFKCRKRKN